MIYAGNSHIIMFGEIKISCDSRCMRKSFSAFVVADIGSFWNFQFKLLLLEALGIVSVNFIHINSIRWILLSVLT